MYCKYCGKKIDDAIFCPYCGKKLKSKEIIINDKEEIKEDVVEEVEVEVVNEENQTSSNNKETIDANDTIESSKNDDERPWSIFAKIGYIGGLISFIVSFFSYYMANSRILFGIACIVFSALGRKSVKQKNKANLGLGFSIAAVAISISIYLLVSLSLISL